MLQAKERRAVSIGPSACQAEKRAGRGKSAGKHYSRIIPWQMATKGQITRTNFPITEHCVASQGLNIDEQQAVDRFRTNVVEPSMTALVILDFWAEWCGPCKALTPLLEKVAAEYADKGVLLAKVNVDEEPFIAQQFQVRSIPTVYAIFQGQPVADLTQARGESELKTQLEALLAKLPPASRGRSGRRYRPAAGDGRGRAGARRS